MRADAEPGGGRVRVGGRWTVGDVATTWSVADGSRGRRWRATSTSPQGSLAYALETDTAGGFLKIEAATADALLTLHREADGSLHGHVVRPAQVDHLALGAIPSALLLVEGEILTAAALVVGAGRRKERVADGGRIALVHVTRSLDVATTAGRIEGGEAGHWRISAADRRIVELVVDDRGLPIVTGALRWPLER